MVAGGVESMSRAPFVMPKADAAFQRSNAVYDTTIGWRFINPLLDKQFGSESMPETAENLSADYHISREDQDAFALRSQQRAAAAIENGRFAQEIAPFTITDRKNTSTVVAADEQPRETSAEKLAALKTPFRKNGTVTAGNASSVNDGAAALIIASKQAIQRYGLTPLARISGMATAGVAPRIMGIGPVPATHKLLQRHNLKLSDIGLIELNEAFAAQALACMRALGLDDDAAHVNPNGGAIALGHPLGMSGSRLVLTAALEMQMSNTNHALATMCVGVGQGISMLLSRP